LKLLHASARSGSRRVSSRHLVSSPYVTSTLARAGNHDRGVLPVNGDHLHEQLPHSKSDKVDAGHFAWTHAADQYATLISDWWRREGEMARPSLSAKGARS
jgi:pimeloyl-ACP methyl ester carboxylesterase